MIAILQYGYAFLGVGTDLEAAIQDAAEWTDPPLTQAMLASGEPQDGDYIWVEVTPELADAIYELGGEQALAASVPRKDGTWDVDPDWPKIQRG